MFNPPGWKQLTMLFYSVTHETSLACRFVHSREELTLFIVVVLLDTAVPGQAVGCKISFVRGRDSRSLLIDAIESPYERIVAQGHM